MDIEKAKAESPFKNTISHGYLTLSVLPHLWGQIVEVRNIKSLINYGIKKLKFNQSVIVDSEVRLKASLQSIDNLRGIAKAEMKVTMEIKDPRKSAFDAVIVFLYHFEEEYI